MPYIPLLLDLHVPVAVRDLISKVFDKSLLEARTVLMARLPDQGPQGSMQLAQATVLLAIADGAAQLLHPGTGKKMREGERFQDFFRQNAPWSLDPPDGLSVDEACDFLWNEARCALIHRLGIRGNLRDPRTPKLLTVKFGNAFSAPLDDALMTIERLTTQRPCTEATIRKNETRYVLWLESFYWMLRMTIVSALSTPEKAIAVQDWVSSGDFDPLLRKQKKMLSLAAAAPVTT